MLEPRFFKSGDRVRYISDVHKIYTGKSAAAVDFDLEHRIMGIRFDDGEMLAVFWDEVEPVEE